MTKNITIIGSLQDVFDDIKNKLIETGNKVSHFDLNTSKETLHIEETDLVLLELIFPFHKCKNIFDALCKNPNKPILYCFCEKIILDENLEQLKNLNPIYPISKVFPKPLKKMDIVDSVHKEFNPNDKSLKVILVIDDSPTQLAITIKALSKNYNVITASTGKEGLMLAMSENPDLILLDLNMPDTNGLKVCADLKSFHPTDKTPIVVFSSTNDKLLINKAFLVGASDYIDKAESEKNLIKNIDIFLNSNYICFNDN